jgi:5-methylcytosine-specific restriction endonuclease McrA
MFGWVPLRPVTAFKGLKKMRNGFFLARPRRSGRRPPVPARVRRMVFMRDGYRCRYCGSPFNLQLDHIVPYSWGGFSAPTNLQVLCRACNRRKGARYAG